LVLIEPGREPHTATGEVRGYVLEIPPGSGGFGYDPLFLYPPFGRSFATLTEKEKNAVSHRRNAADALLAALQERG
ncbi:MAG: non-canonical purine NTP pyrophosphatase, partial [Candidatus Cybelea sp.]